MNLESIISASRMRDNAVAELCKAIDELDLAALHRIVAYAASRIEAIEHYDLVGDPRVLEDTAKRIARAEKGVRTRRRNATKAKKFIAADAHKKPKPKPNVNAKKKAAVAPSSKAAAVIEYVTAHPGFGPHAIGEALTMLPNSVSVHLTGGKKAHLLYNEKGKWYPSQRQIQGHPRAKNALKKLNGAAVEAKP